MAGDNRRDYGSVSIYFDNNRKVWIASHWSYGVYSPG